MTLVRLKELLRDRRAHADSEPCAEYIPKTVGGYGYDSCIKCAWAEPEHLIDALDRELGTSEATREQMADRLERAYARIATLERAMAEAHSAVTDAQAVIATLIQRSH